MTTIICKTNNQMKADVKLNKLAKLQLHMLNVRQTTALTVRHYANVMLWLKFRPMGLKLKFLMYVWNTFRGHIKLQKHFRLTVWRLNIDNMIDADENKII